MFLKEKIRYFCVFFFFFLPSACFLIINNDSKAPFGLKISFHTVSRAEVSGNCSASFLLHLPHSICVDVHLHACFDIMIFIIILFKLLKKEEAVPIVPKHLDVEMFECAQIKRLITGLLSTCVSSGDFPGVGARGRPPVLSQHVPLATACSSGK